jgi:hypothetical protein
LGSLSKVPISIVLLPVNGGVKTSHVAGQKSTTSGYLERAMETG